MLGKQPPLKMFLDDDGYCWVYEVDLQDIKAAEYILKIPEFVQGFVPVYSMDQYKDSNGEQYIEIVAKHIRKIKLQKDSNKVKEIIQRAMFGGIGRRANSDAQIGKLIIEGQNIPLEGMMHCSFYGLNVNHIEFKDFDARKIVNIEGMFFDCKAETIDFSGATFGKLENTCQTFYYCKNLKEIDISQFNMENIENMFQMFTGANSLRKIVLPKIKIRDKTNMDEAFSECESLTDINIDNIQTVEYGQSLDGTFSGCKSLNYLDFRNIDFQKVRSITKMLEGCTNLHTLDLSSMTEDGIVKHLINRGMGFLAKNLKEIIVRKEVGSDETIDFSGATFGKLENTCQTFYYCKNLKGNNCKKRSWV